MPKSKQQKRDEAIARLRANFSWELAKYLRAQRGGKTYEQTVATYNRHSADHAAWEAKKEYKAFCESAKLDHWGNPL